jgi:hypothetical protein
MKPGHVFAFTGLIPSLLVGAAFGADQVVLQLRLAGGQPEVHWHANFQLPVSGTFPAYTIQRSTDMRAWEVVAGPVSGGIGVSDETLRLALPPDGGRAFYRVVASVQPAPAGNYGDAVFGYATEFSRELQRLGQLSLDDFVQLYTPTNQYLPGIAFDPTTAQFWDLFNLKGFSLNTNEFAVFQTNGFVVTPRLGSYSFADEFYKIYSADLPVFVSTDAALQAWHRSYIGMLEELEETYLSPRLQSIVQGMAGQLSSLSPQAQGTALEQRCARRGLLPRGGTVTGDRHQQLRAAWTKRADHEHADGDQQPAARRNHPLRHQPRRGLLSVHGSWTLHHVPAPAALLPRDDVVRARRLPLHRVHE